MNLQNQKARRVVQILCCALGVALCLFWLGFIFSNSAKPASESSEQSSKVHGVVNQVAQSVGIKQEIPEKTVREGAHFTEFAVLGVLVCLTLTAFWWLFGGRSVYRLMLISLTTIPFCAGMAIADEYLQTFFAGRAAQATDVLLDTAGGAVAVIGFAVILSVMILVRKRRRGKTERAK